MTRTGKRLYYALFLVIPWIIGAAGVVQAQVEVEGTVSESEIFTGERIRFSVEISGDFNDVSRPTVPDQFEGIRLLSSNPSISRNFSMINGETSTTYSYVYSFAAEEEGSFEIPSFEVQVDGETYRTEPVSINIRQRSAAAQSGRSSSRPDIFLRLEVSDEQPVVGQQLIANVVLYFRDGLEVNSYQPRPGWKAEGFWKEELDSIERPRAESMILDGVRYRKARLLQYALFPTKTGELEISPFEVVVSVRSQTGNRDRFGSFFGGFGSNNRRVDLETEPVPIDVRSLPNVEDADLISAVGSFDIERRINNREILVGESIEIETRIEGRGNISLISKPEYDLPEGLEVYDPQENSVINRRGEQIVGHKTFTDMLIARNPGEYTIPETVLAYYDDRQDRIVRETLPEITFTVNRDPNGITLFEDGLSMNIRPVTGLANWTAASTRPVTRYWWFWGGIALPALALALGYWQKTYRDKLKHDAGFARAEKASERASDRLEAAVQHSEKGNIKQAYNMLHKALTGYIGDRLGLPEAGLSDEQYIQTLEDRNTNKELVKNIRMLLNKCATVSYAPDPSHEYLKSHVGLAESMIQQLKKEL